MSDVSSAPTTGRTQVVLADDHALLRQGLKLLLHLYPEITVVGEACTGHEAIEQVRALQPQVVVLDISLPDMNGLEACRAIRASTPHTQVLILTMHESHEYFFQALHAGAAGYLVKKAAPAELRLAILSLAQGGVFLSSSQAKALIHAYMALPPDPSQAAPEDNERTDAFDALSPRQLQIAQLLVQGETNQQIAEHLGISVKTVQAHRACVMERLGLEHFAQLVRLAIRSGMLSSGGGNPENS